MKTILTAMFTLAMVIGATAQCPNCRWICSPYGPFWHCDETQSPGCRPWYPPPNCNGWGR